MAGRYVYEGDNRQDGVELARVLLGTLFKSKNGGDDDVEVHTPGSWDSIGGAQSREARSFPSVI